MLIYIRNSAREFEVILSLGFAFSIAIYILICVSAVCSVCLVATAIYAVTAGGDGGPVLL